MNEHKRIRKCAKLIEINRVKFSQHSINRIQELVIKDIFENKKRQFKNFKDETVIIRGTIFDYPISQDGELMTILLKPDQAKIYSK